MAMRRSARRESVLASRAAVRRCWDSWSSATAVRKERSEPMLQAMTAMMTVWNRIWSSPIEAERLVIPSAAPAISPESVPMVTARKIVTR